MRAFSGLALALAACAPQVTHMKDPLPICTTVAACDADDGRRIVVAGVYGLYPDQPGVDYTGVPRAVRITLADGIGPFLEPYWSKEAIRPAAEVARYSGRRVLVTGRYARVQPTNPRDPPHASAMGGSCIHPVEAIEPAE